MAVRAECITGRPNRGKKPKPGASTASAPPPRRSACSRGRGWTSSQKYTHNCGQGLGGTSPSALKPGSSRACETAPLAPGVRIGCRTLLDEHAGEGPG